MKKTALLTFLLVLFTSLGFAQTGRAWSAGKESKSLILKDKSVYRLSFPKEFQLFSLDIALLRQVLFSVAGNQARHTAIISLPNADGGMEDFEVVEASNFEPALQAQFPEIRAFSGKCVTDRSATLKISISPQGIQTMIFRTGKDNEFIEAYSQDHTVYAVFRSHRNSGQLPWTCSTVDTQLAEGLNAQVANAGMFQRSGADLKTMRLAQSCNGEYANYFGATDASQVALVLAAFNATLTRCNGVYEKDLALHLNLIANTTSVIYYNPSTDPYSTTLSSWNAQLQSTLTSVIGEANYDIGHMFGASGGGGNAGCIGCVCTNGSKGSGITSPADGIPQGDNFDIDYVVHEVGHQLGANHTFSYASEGTGVNKEIGSGITIMGYAGITSYDVASHSIDIYHEASIAQIQANLATKTCPVTTSIASTNATPVVAAGSNYTIPVSTPFALTGNATDANAGDVLTYCWEQNDNTTTTGANSKASPTKTTGPNWISFSPTTSPTRYFPQLSTILAGGLTTGPLTGGDAGITTEALSSVARTLNFRLTVRDNALYSSTAPISVGQTNFTDMVVTVSAASGPFAVTSPNTAVSWAGGSSQPVTWSVAGTTSAPVSCANVKITLSTDGGLTFPTILIAGTPNDGTETVVIPNTPTTTGRIKVEAVGNIFFDISNTNFTITAGSSFSTISTSAISPISYCAGNTVSVPFTTNGTASAGNIFTAQLSDAAGSFTSPVSIGTLTSPTAGTISAGIPAGTTAGTGYRIRVVSSNPFLTGSDNGADITVNVAPVASVLTASGATTFCAGSSIELNGNSTGGTWSVGGTTATSLTVTTAGDYYVTTTNGCGTVTSNHIIVSVLSLPTVTASNVTGCAGSSVMLSGSPAGGTFSVANPYDGPSTPYTYIYTNANGCTNTSTAAMITMNPLPTVTAGSYGPFTTASAAVTLTGSPAGGTFSGTGVSGNSFNPATAGVGTFTISYNYTNANGCAASATTNISVNSVACNYTVGTISGPANACPYMGPADGDATYTIPVTGASSYTWVVPANTSIVSGQGTNMIVVHYSNAFVSGYLNVTVGNACGGASTLVKLSVKTTLPSTPGSITGPTNACTHFGTGNAATYTIRKVANSSSYSWTVPAGAVISLHPGGTGVNDTIINVLYDNSFVSGTAITVKASSFCGTSASARSLTITRTNPSVPGAISGPIDACPYAGTGVQATYIVRTQTNASSYVWMIPANATATHPGVAGTSNDTIIKVVFSGAYTSGVVTVSAVNGCLTTAARSLTVTKTLPAAPSKIYGDPAGASGSNTAAATDACPYIFSGTNAVYSINRVKVTTEASGYAPSYNWVLTDPINSHIISHPGGTGVNDTIITVHFDAAFTTGAVQVQSIRDCGSSSLKSVSVTKKAPGTPDVISGPVAPCPATIQTYTVNAVNATTFNWTFPSTISLISGAGTNTVQLQLSSTYNGGTVRVSTTSACGTSAARSLATTKCVATRPYSKTAIASLPLQSTIYPNPSDGDFRILLNNTINNLPVMIALSNEFGQVVYQSSLKADNGSVDLKLSNKLANGIYLVTCMVNGEKTVKKLIVSK